MNSGIYSIENIIDGKSYIGSSVNISSRWRKHLTMLRKSIHNNHHLQNAYNKYGESNFIFKIIEYTIYDDLKKIEQSYLNKAKLSPSLYYNINYDADRINFTDEIKKKMSDKAIQFRKEHPNFYKQYLHPHSKETIEKIKLARKHQIITNETKSKLSTHLINRWKTKIFREPKKTDNNVYTFKNTVTEEIFIGRRVDFYKKYHLQQDAVCRMIRSMLDNKIRKHKHWIVFDENHVNMVYIRKSHYVDKNIYTFKNTITNEIFNGYRKDFYRKYNLNSSNVDSLIKLKRKSHKNWILI